MFLRTFLVWFLVFFSIPKRYFPPPFIPVYARVFYKISLSTGHKYKRPSQNTGLQGDDKLYTRYQGRTFCALSLFSCGGMEIRRKVRKQAVTSRKKLKVIPMQKETTRLNCWNHYLTNQWFRDVKLCICLHMDKRPKRIEKYACVKISVYWWMWPQLSSFSACKLSQSHVASPASLVPLLLLLSGLQYLLPQFSHFLYQQ